MSSKRRRFSGELEAKVALEALRGEPGSKPSPLSTPISSSSSTRPVPPPRWPGAAAALCADIGAGRRCLTATGRPQPSSAP